MNIRKATLKDINKLLPLIRSFQEEALAEYEFRFDVDHIKAKTSELCKNCSFIIETDTGDIVGLLAGTIVNDMIGGEHVYQEIMWYMDSSYRRYGIKLLRHVEKYLKDIGVRKIIMVHLGNLNRDKLEQFYINNNYKLLEVQYIKEL